MIEFQCYRWNPETKKCKYWFNWTPLSDYCNLDYAPRALRNFAPTSNVVTLTVLVILRGCWSDANITRSFAILLNFQRKSQKRLSAQIYTFLNKTAPKSTQKVVKQVPGVGSDNEAVDWRQARRGDVWEDDCSDYQGKDEKWILIQIFLFRI